MTPATIVREAHAEGVRLALSPSGNIKATGNGEAVNRWLSVIREHKTEIIDLLSGDSVTISRWWRIRFVGRDPQEIHYCPAASQNQVIAEFPGAICAEPIAEATRQPDDDVPDRYGHWSQSETLHCMERIRQFVRRGVPEAVADDLACRLVQRDRDQDDRRSCAECRAFRNGACVQGKVPFCGGGVEVLHRCKTFIDPEVKHD